MAFDPKCYEVAEHFLPSGSSATLKERMAQHLQDEAEFWLESESVRIANELGAKSTPREVP
jgi:hypothetical protein